MFTTESKLEQNAREITVFFSIVFVCFCNQFEIVVHPTVHDSLAARRSRRSMGSKKNSRLQALERLKKAKAGDNKSRYQVGNSKAKRKDLHPITGAYDGYLVVNYIMCVEWTTPNTWLKFWTTETAETPSRSILKFTKCNEE